MGPLFAAIWGGKYRVGRPEIRGDHRRVHICNMRQIEKRTTRFATHRTTAGVTASTRHDRSRRQTKIRLW
jgi:hypothetical protein